jgi:uncharacterized membrane protein YjjP (DUF1212 family)
MIGQIGTALLASSQATSDVEDTLNRIAGSYHRPDLRIFVLPTLVIVEDTRATPATTEIFPADQAALRLDQSDEIERLVRRIGSDQTDPATVIATISEIRDRAPRFGVLLSILGHTLLTVGFGLVLNPTVTALPVYLVLGVLVGAIVVLGNRSPTLALILPVVTAFAVTLLISLLVRPLVHDDVLRLVAPALVTFLPGLSGWGSSCWRCCSGVTAITRARPNGCALLME